MLSVEPTRWIGKRIVLGTDPSESLKPKVESMDYRRQCTRDQILGVFTFLTETGSSSACASSTLRSRSDRKPARAVSGDIHRSTADRSGFGPEKVIQQDDVPPGSADTAHFLEHPDRIGDDADHVSAYTTSNDSSGKPRVEASICHSRTF